MAKKDTCKRCTHGIEHHHKKGPCSYGHETLFKGCRCPGFNARKSIPDVPLDEENTPNNDSSLRIPLLAFIRTIREACARLEASLGIHEIDPTKVLVPKILEQSGYARDLTIRIDGHADEEQQDEHADEEQQDEEQYHRDKREPHPALLQREALAKENNLSKCERNILTALAQGGPMSHNRLAVFAGYSPKSGGFAGALADLREIDFVRGDGKEISIREPGLEALGDYAALPEEGEHLFLWWVNRRKKKGEQDILVGLQHLKTASHDQLAKHIGKSPTSGGFAGDLATLRKLGLIEGSGKAIRLVKELREK